VTLTEVLTAVGVAAVGVHQFIVSTRTKVENSSTEKRLKGGAETFEAIRQQNTAQAAEIAANRVRIDILERQLAAAVDRLVHLERQMGALEDVRVRLGIAEHLLKKKDAA
jgi:hypothetical protein